MINDLILKNFKYVTIIHRKVDSDFLLLGEDFRKKCSFNIFLDKWML